MAQRAWEKVPSPLVALEADGDGDVGVAGLVEEAVDKAGAEGGVSPGGGDAEEVELGALEDEAKSEDVVDVVADIGVEDDFLRGDVLRRLGEGREGKCEEEEEGA